MPLPAGHPEGDYFCSLCVRITLNGERLDLGTTGVYCWESQWCAGNRSKPGQIIGTAPFPATNAEEANLKISSIYSKIRMTYLRLSEDPELRLIQLQHALLIADGKPSAVQKAARVVGVIEEYLAHQVKRFEAGEITKTTKVNRFNYARLFKLYLAYAKKSTIQVRDVTHGLMDDFKHYLATVRHHKHTHSGKVMEFVKQAFTFCHQRKLILDNPMVGYVIKKAQSEMDTTHLEEEQLTVLIRFDPYKLADQGLITEQGAASLDRERDAFVFTCLTGQHDGDFKGKAYEVVQSKSGNWLKGRRGKTGSIYEVPLDPFALKIIRKYGGIQNLPFVSNKTRNQTLKLLAMYAQIPVHLTTKIGRKTFADRALNIMGMSVDEVAQMLGHRDSSYVKHYARIRNVRLMEKFIPLQTAEPEGIRRLPTSFNHSGTVDTSQTQTA
ncbi:site-specific integrase [Larkinella ripae]